MISSAAGGRVCVDPKSNIKGAQLYILTSTLTHTLLHPPLPNQKEDWVAERATGFLDSGDSQLASPPLDSISATASLPGDYKGFLLSGDS